MGWGGMGWDGIGWDGMGPDAAFAAHLPKLWVRAMEGKHHHRLEELVKLELLLRSFLEVYPLEDRLQC